MPQASAIDARHLPLGKNRVLPLGWRRGLYGLGQDDGFDLPIDLPAETPIFTDAAFQTPTAPDINFNPSPTILPAGTVGPLAPGEISAPGIPGVSMSDSTNLNQLILTGAIPPPQGSAITSAQAQQIAANGGNANDIGAVLTGRSTFAQTMQALSSGLSAATRLAQLPSTPGGVRPGPVTAAIGVTSSPGTLANPLAALEQSTIIAGVPNWMVAIGAIGVAGLLAGAMHKGRR